MMGLPSWELTYSPSQGMFEDDVPFPKMGYVMGSLEATFFLPTSMR